MCSLQALTRHLDAPPTEGVVSPATTVSAAILESLRTEEDTCRAG